MTPDEHFVEAERLREAARDASDFEWRSYFNEAALVHATLALFPTAGNGRRRRERSDLNSDRPGLD